MMNNMIITRDTSRSSLSIGNKLSRLGYEDFSVLRELLGWGETIDDQHPRVQETFRLLSGE